MKTPIILLLSDLLKPVKISLDFIGKSREEVDKARSSIVERSIFSYVVSLFEILLTDILSIILDAFPEKIKKSEFRIDKNNLSSDIYQIKKETIDNYIQSLAYVTMQDYMNTFFDALSIQPLAGNYIELLVEMKETRNLLLHNNLKMNSTYQRKAGAIQRKAEYNGYLPLPRKYILESIDILVLSIQHIKQELEIKYKKYNQVYVLKSIWEHLFSSSILMFDDYWQDTSNSLKFKKTVRQFKSLIKHNYASSEVVLLFVWINHFNPYLCDKCFAPSYVNTYTLDANYRNKYMYLNGIIVNYPDLFKV